MAIEAVSLGNERISMKKKKKKNPWFIGFNLIGPSG